METAMEWAWLIAVVLFVVGSIAWRFQSDKAIAKMVAELEKNDE